MENVLWLKRHEAAALWLRLLDLWPSISHLVTSLYFITYSFESRCCLMWLSLMLVEQCYLEVCLTLPNTKRKRERLRMWIKHRQLLTRCWQWQIRRDEWHVLNTVPRVLTWQYSDGWFTEHLKFCIQIHQPCMERLISLFRHVCGAEGTAEQMCHGSCLPSWPQAPYLWMNSFLLLLIVQE